MEKRVVHLRKGSEASTSVEAGGSFEVMIVTEPKAMDVLELGDAHFRLNSPVFLPHDFDEVEPVETALSSGITLIERALRHLELTDLGLLIAGHTDTVGADADNVTLSELRADCVKALITGDRELFGSVADSPHIPDKRKKEDTLRKDKLQICEWVSIEFDHRCSLKQNGSDFIRAFKAFQQAHNDRFGGSLAVDGDWGPLTWKAAFDFYEEKLADRLMLKRADLPTFRNQLGVAERLLGGANGRVGCGEFKPLENPGRDNLLSRTNRRVELLFLDPAEPVNAPCLNGPCAERQCPLFEPLEPNRGTVVQVNWSEPLVLAGYTQDRQVEVRKAGIEAEDPVEFAVYLISIDEPTPKRIASAQDVLVEAGVARGEFNELDEAVRRQLPVVYPLRYSYFFSARGKDFEVFSARLHSDLDNILTF